MTSQQQQGDATVGIRDVLLICPLHDTSRFEPLLGGDRQWGINVQYAVQATPEGIAQAFFIGADFIAGNPATHVLGDNFIYGDELTKEIAWRSGWVKPAQLENIASALAKSSYGQYLHALLMPPLIPLKH
jgi:dTDP-glucose pyrophosphorylase